MIFYKDVHLKSTTNTISNFTVHQLPITVTNNIRWKKKESSCANIFSLVCMAFYFLVKEP